VPRKGSSAFELYASTPQTESAGGGLAKLQTVGADVGTLIEVVVDGTSVEVDNSVEDVADETVVVI